MNTTLWKVGALISAITLAGGYVAWQASLAGKKAEQSETLEVLPEDDPVLMLSSKSLGGGFPVIELEGNSDFLIPANDELTLMPSSKVGIQAPFIEIPGIPKSIENPLLNLEPVEDTTEEQMRRTLMNSSKRVSIQITEEDVEKLIEKGESILKDQEKAKTETQP